MLAMEGFLRLVVKEQASDLIVKTGAYPAVRINGLVRYISDEAVTKEMSLAFLNKILDEEGLEELAREGAVDKAVDLEDIGRFRCNVFRQQGELGFVFRHIKAEIPGFKDLNLPVEPLKKLASLRRGLVLATGIAGSGKSTTLASMIDYVNKNMHRHIVTIEDPVEFLFQDKRSIVNQREIGRDCPDFHTALRHAVRQSPDIIFIGEMRDRETVSAAISAAETGHLVFSTLHTVNAVQTVERIVTFFPPHQHQLVRLQLSLNLAGVISLRLIRVKNGSGLMPAVELLMNTPTVREILAEGRTRELPKALFEGQYYGTMTFNQSILKLYELGNITFEEAMAASDNPDELKLLMRGITTGAASSRKGG